VHLHEGEPVRDRYALIPGETWEERAARFRAEATRAAERATRWSVIAIALAAFSLGMAIRGILDGLGH
jgi:hypothetical protein